MYEVDFCVSYVSSTRIVVWGPVPASAFASIVQMIDEPEQAVLAIGISQALAARGCHHLGHRPTLAICHRSDYQAWADEVDAAVAHYRRPLVRWAWGTTTGRSSVSLAYALSAGHEEHQRILRNVMQTEVLQDYPHDFDDLFRCVSMYVTLFPEKVIEDALPHFTGAARAAWSRLAGVWPDLVGAVVHVAEHRGDEDDDQVAVYRTLVDLTLREATEAARAVVRP